MTSRTVPFKFPPATARRASPFLKIDDLERLGVVGDRAAIRCGRPRSAFSSPAATASVIACHCIHRVSRVFISGNAGDMPVSCAAGDTAGINAGGRAVSVAKVADRSFASIAMRFFDRSFQWRPILHQFDRHRDLVARSQGRPFGLPDWLGSSNNAMRCSPFGLKHDSESARRIPRRFRAVGFDIFSATPG